MSIPAQRKIQLGNMAFAVIGGGVLWPGHFERHGWAVDVYAVVILVGMLAASAVAVVEGLRTGTGYLNGPDDLDRPGGPYDKLHGRI